ncbi:N(6)-adenine-specific methyltransferase METTL4 [Pezoporus occidentalis]|uniref:N(6)-adenine-specific methyltransferase METTL4 n=1 Tax=Pezoporus occidentalis TaxID=407982 RepID=UPI002F90F4A9
MMSVVHRLTAGWLVDHLSFINQCGYEICDSFAYPDGVTLNTSVISTRDCHPTSTFAATSSSDGPVPGLGDAIETEGKPAKTRYTFREEFFDVSKPHIAAAPEEQLWQGCPEASLTELKASSSRGEHQAETKSGVGDSVVSARKKRKRKCVFNQGELDALQYHSKVRKLIWEGTLHLVQEGLKSGFLHRTIAEPSCRKNAVPGHIGCGLAELCEMAKQLTAVNESDHQAVHVLDDETSIPEWDPLSCVTENSSNCAKIVELMGQKYLVPPKSSFLLSDISCLQPLLNYKKYDVIVIDPPWENKSVKRSSRYSYLSSCQIKQIPVPALAAPNCLVVTWVTNRQKHLHFVKDELYPHWSVKTLAEWHWVKITGAGEFVFPLDSLHKKPYEVLVLGRVQGDAKETSRKSEDVLPVPEHKLIVSIPCSLHSHKPPLTGVLAEFLKPDVECLELFARNLQPGWTSWGNEVLKFQHMDYFTVLRNEN